jgi:GMP synthase-like glutamine amidotransferase
MILWAPVISKGPLSLSRGDCAENEQGSDTAMAKNPLRIQCFQHVPFEGPGSISDWARDRGHALNLTRWYDGEGPPEPGSYDWLVVLGGPMSVHDEEQHPWLSEEKGALETAVRSGKTVLGICLGAQLLARVLGAAVRPNPFREIGWFPIRMHPDARESRVFSTLPESCQVFHWHGETFEAPPGALPMAASEACPNQAFSLDDRVIGLQFHLETTEEGARALVESCADEIDGSRFVQPPEVLLAHPLRFAEANRRMTVFLDALEGADRA